MNKVKVGVFGAGGRMGQEISRLFSDQSRLVPWVGVDRHGKAQGFQKLVPSLADSAAGEAELWIDFSTAASFDEVLKHCVSQKRPLVSGTTGLSEEQKKRLELASREIPLLWASNMSLGVAVLNEALKLFGKLKGFDFQIEEIHHNRKLDKPSGTAITLQETLQAAVQSPLPEPLAIRGGGVFGVHKAWAFSDEELLMFEHQALNRAVFARGALRAADWVIDRGPGLYRMQDVLSGIV